MQEPLNKWMNNILGKWPVQTRAVLMPRFLSPYSTNILATIDPILTRCVLWLLFLCVQR